MISEDIHNKVVEVIKMLTDKTFDIYNITIEPDISYNLRGAFAGTASFSKNLIKLNRFLIVENLDRYIEDTIPHEFAHLVTKKLYPFSKPHGKEWKSVMKTLGYTPERCHNMDTSNAVTIKKEYLYKCKCSEMMFSRIRHKRAQSYLKNYNKEYYSCRKCKGKLVFIKN